MIGQLYRVGMVNGFVQQIHHSARPIAIGDGEFSTNALAQTFFQVNAGSVHGVVHTMYYITIDMA